MAGEEERTREVFGDYVSIYDFAQSIEDGATVPLYYENRMPELQLVNENFERRIRRADRGGRARRGRRRRDSQRRFARQYHLITRDDRLDKIADDLVHHFAGRGYRGKAMFVAIDKATALRMHDKVRGALGRRDRRAREARSPARRPTSARRIAERIAWHARDRHGGDRQPRPERSRRHGRARASTSRRTASGC